MSKTKLLFVTFIFVISMKTYAYPVAFTAKQVKEQITSLTNSSNIVVLLDIDDTIITPQSLTFRKAPYNKIIDEIKSKPAQYPNYKEIISNWRLQRKAMLIDPKWPLILEELKNKYKVFGLTKVNTGKFGNIESMEIWRYEELKSLGIFFSNYDGHLVKEDNKPSFYKGIMMTGSANKKDTLAQYFAHISPVSTIIFVDDREKNLKEIQEFCQGRGLKFLGIHYKGLEHSKDRQSEEVYQLQKRTLINEARWLSDTEANKIIETIE